MHPAISSNIPVIIFLSSLVLIACLIKYWGWSTKLSKKKSPLTQDLLRGPGDSLRIKIDDMTTDILAYLTITIVIPLIGYASVLSQSMAKGKLPNTFTFAFIAVISLCIVGFMLYKTYRTLKLRRQYSLGLEAEVAVGQELNLLMRDGYWVFHDFPADNFNIDHIVIGKNGIFAVETKGRPKRFNPNGKVDAEVVFDGSKLTFPGWSETKPIEQAQRQAKWLQDWLTKAIGQTVNTQPVLALPGWYVKRTTQNGLPVINGKNPGKLFEKYGTQLISEQLINQIVYQIEQKCRTVAPRSYV